LTLLDVPLLWELLFRSKLRLHIRYYKKRNKT
jgi:hypothetical protein